MVVNGLHKIYFFILLHWRDYSWYSSIMKLPIALVVWVFCLGLLTPVTHAQQNAIPVDPIETAIGTGNPAKIARTVQDIQSRIDTGSISYDLWRIWLPALMNTNHFSEVADLSLSASLARPGIEAIEPCMEFRAKALLAMGKANEALSAAKSYYNVCQLKNTGNALTLVSTCLSATHPDNPSQGQEFRYQQVMASASAYGTTQPSAEVSILKSIMIDPAPYETQINAYSRRLEFAEGIAYGNLLLAADRTSEAESAFRKLFKSADSQARLTQAIDGIARSLRAEDGNVARANAWLLSLQHATAMR